MQQPFNQPLHYTTQNEKLAFALHIVGFKCLGIFNRYTDKLLDELGYQTATAAAAAGKPGNLEYVFERTEFLAEALVNYDKCGEAFTEGEQIQLTVLQAEAITIVRATMRRYEPFRSEWRKFPAVYVQGNAGETVKSFEGQKEVQTIPGFKFASTNLDATKRAKLFGQ